VSKHPLITYIFAAACLINSSYTLTDVAAQAASTTDYISSQYLNATFGEEKVTPPAPVDDSNLTFMERFNKLLDPKKEGLSPREVQKIGFDIVASNQKFESTIIDNSCIDKVKLVGGGENSQQHLLGTIFNDIKTATGKAHAAFTFCHPTTDVTTLRNRQQAIALLSATDTTKIDTALTKIKSVEEKSYIFWSSKNPVNAELLKPLYFNSFLTSCNTNTVALESSNRLLQTFQLAFGALYVPAVTYMELYIIASMNNMSCKQLFTLMPALQKSILILPIALQGLMAYATFRGLQTTGEISNHLQDILIATTSHINALKTLSSHVKNNPKLLQQLPSLNSINFLACLTQTHLLANRRFYLLLGVY